ncbi:MAG: PorT family protein [Bacteroidales bacterium]|nr:PorT family protein [Bacteroidales bacterium]
MKKYLIVIAAAILAFSATASAQMNFGVTAGMNFNSAKIGDVKMDARAGWNVGATVQFDLPLGFSLQPSLVYMQKSAGYETPELSSGILEDLKARFVQTVGSLVLPVSVQWGPDLLVARPFLDVTPYVGYSLSNKIKKDVAGLEKVVKGGNGLDYGLGLGAGINVWKLQAIVRYNWNFGVLGSYEDFADIDPSGIKFEDETFGGITVSVAFFF